MAEEGHADCFIRFGVRVGIGSFRVGSVAAVGWVMRCGEGRVGELRVVAWLKGGLESGFGVFVFEALDHTLEGRVEELEPFLQVVRWIGLMYFEDLL